MINYLNNIWHVLPINDLESHIEEIKKYRTKVEEGVYKINILCPCNCAPKIKYEGNGIIIIHNSFDGREGLEWVNEILENERS